MNRATMSKLELLASCGAWAREDAEWTEHSMYEQEGNAIDAPFAEYIRSGGKIDAFTRTDDASLAQMWRHAKVWLTEHFVVGMRAQVVFAYDPILDAGREVAPLPDAPTRFYAIPEERKRHGIHDHELCGAVDIVAMGVDDNGGFVSVDDLKVRLGPEVKDATSQLAGLALAACRAYGCERARVRTLVVSEYGFKEIPIWIDGWALDAVAGEIRRAIDRVPEAQPNPGPWCTERYCPHLAHCPAQVRDVESAERLVPVDALVKRRADLPLALTFHSPDHAADVLARARAIERIADMLKKAAADYIGEGKPLSSGEWIAPTFRNVTRMNSGALEALARELGATDEQLALCAKSAREGAGIRVQGAKKGRAA